MMDGVARMIVIIIEAEITIGHPIGRMITTIVRITTAIIIGLEEAMAVAIDAETKIETIPIGETMVTAGITMGIVGVEVTRGTVKAIRATIVRQVQRRQASGRQRRGQQSFKLTGCSVSESCRTKQLSAAANKENLKYP